MHELKLFITSTNELNLNIDKYLVSYKEITFSKYYKIVIKRILSRHTNVPATHRTHHIEEAGAPSPCIVPIKRNAS